jgi:hypothetical protein
MTLLAVLGAILTLTCRQVAGLKAAPLDSEDTVFPIISCTPEKPTVWPREQIQVQAWVPDSAKVSNYDWSATGGSIGGNGPKVMWDFTGIQSGTYTATVKYKDEKGALKSCVLQVFVLDRGGERGLDRLSGRSFLVGDAAEREGYGLYSYLLFAAPPDDDASRERYTRIIESYLNLIQDVVRLENSHAKPSELNNTYLPLDADPPRFASPDWILQHYNYARALVLLRAIPGTHRNGPYIVSASKPLSNQSGSPERYIFQDLSIVPPHLVGAWIKLFLNQAAQEHFWESQSMEAFVLKLRTSIGILAIGLPQVQNSLDALIAWKHSVAGS